MLSYINQDKSSEVKFTKFTIVPVIIAIPVFALLGWMIPSIMYDHAAKHSIVEQLRDVQ